MFSESDLLPLSGLQHLAFCERQWALIHLEGAWAENRLTVEGRHLHEKVHDAGPEVRDGVRIARGLRLHSLRLGLVGQADVVEFHRVNTVQKQKTAGKMPAPQSPETAGEMPAPQSPETAGKMLTPQSPEAIVKSAEPPLKMGSCVLGRSDCARMVQDALLHFEGTRYYLVAWCIMPNHVHAIVAPLGGFTLSAILHSWKSFTANRINDLLKREGALWERESFDHAIRSFEDLERFKQYLEYNPVTAGLCARPKEWLFGNCGAGFQPADSYVFTPAAELPFVSPSSRGELPHLYKEGATYFVTFRLIDAVEHPPTPRLTNAFLQPFPVEYKRGRPKPDRCDAVQLCAQAMCLEEMLNVAVPRGALYYGQPRRREEVDLDKALRCETEALAARMHALFRAGVTPAAQYEKKCDRCSLYEICLPTVAGQRKDTRRYLEDLWNEPAGA